MPHSAPKEQLPSSDALDDEPGDRGEDGIHDHVDSTEKKRDIMGLLYRLFEEDGKVVNDCIVNDSKSAGFILVSHFGRVEEITCIAAAHLLHKLTGYTQHHTSEMLRLSSCEYGFQWRSFPSSIA